jgi:hypothetical protein
MLSEHIVVTSAQKSLQVQRISAKCQMLSGHIIVTSTQKSLHAREKKRHERGLNLRRLMLSGYIRHFKRPVFGRQIINGSFRNRNWRCDTNIGDIADMAQTSGMWHERWRHGVNIGDVIQTLATWHEHRRCDMNIGDVTWTSEMSHEHWKHGMNIGVMAQTLHPHPTFKEKVWIGCTKKGNLVMLH